LIHITTGVDGVETTRRQRIVTRPFKAVAGAVLVAAAVARVVAADVVVAKFVL
jgi:hypothetical protein